MYDSFLREYKEKQAELLSQMQDHSDADEQFYLTANMTLNIAKKAKEIFVSSEVDEKRQFLGFLLQNCVLSGKKLEFSMRSPFNLVLNNPDGLTVRRRRDSNSRTLAGCTLSKRVH
jgi:site-specific DNA recombinase